jgi:hypothetical protein
VLRIWDRALTNDEVKKNMMRERPESDGGLLGLYIFDAEGVKDTANGESVALDHSGTLQRYSSIIGGGGGGGWHCCKGVAGQRVYYADSKLEAGAHCACLCASCLSCHGALQQCGVHLILWMQKPDGAALPALSLMVLLYPH